MAERVKHIRHATAQADLFEGLEGEVTVDLTKKTAIVHDGVTPGGRPLAREDLDNSPAATSSTAGKMSALQVQELTTASSKNAAQDSRLDAIDLGQSTQDGRLSANESAISANQTNIAINTADIVELTAADKLANHFRAHEAAVPDMTVILEAGKLLYNGVLVAKSQQTTTVIANPITDPYIVRIVVAMATGVYLIVYGGEHATAPVAPVIPDEYLPVCQFTVEVATSTITNAMLTNELISNVAGLDKSTTLSAAAVAISLSSLSFPTGRAIEVDAYITAIGSSSPALYLELNGDALNTNYYSTSILNDNAPADANTPLLAYLTATTQSALNLVLIPNIAKGTTLIIGRSAINNISSTDVAQHAVVYTISDVITSIAIRDNNGVAALDIGSTLRARLK